MADRILGDHRFDRIPVVGGPDVAGWVNRYVGNHLDIAALELVDGITGLRTRGMALGLGPGHQDDTAPQKLPTQTSSLPSIETPHGTLITLLPSKLSANLGDSLLLDQHPIQQPESFHP